MKKIYSICIILLLAFTSQQLFAQQIGDLKGIHFQAVAIDDMGKEIIGMDINGKPVYNKTIGVKFSILKGKDGAVLYQESHETLTDQHGLFSLVIGEGDVSTTSTYATLMEIPWIDADQFLKVEISIKNDKNYKMVSLQQFMAVPYSFYTDDIADNAITTAKIQDETILNADIANGTVDLSTKVTNVLPVANGGTGAATHTSGSILIGNGTDAVKSLGQAADGQFPIGVTGGDPVLGNITAGTGIVVNNTAGGIQIASSIQGINTQETGAVTVGAIAAGTNFVTQVTLAGVAPGDFVVASYSNPLQGCLMSGYVRNNNQIEVAIYNANNNQKNLGSGTFKVLVIK